MGLPLMLALVDEVTVSGPSGGGTAVTLSLFLH
jgi:anti-sigma regulatory factor (Ser/Thr protein kinase)